MSFQAALDALSSTSHRDAATNPILNSVVTPLQESLTTYPWLLPKEVVPFLLASGIPNSGLGTTPHPHPTHKVIETFLLYNHWSCLATQTSTVMFMKPSKFSKLQALNPNFSSLCNYRLTSADTPRYPETSLAYPSTQTVFMHDALMYFSPSQILDLFLKSPQITSLYASLIVPPESDFTDLSLFPQIYQYSVTGSTLHYVPEGHHAGSYNQPIHALDWLKIHSILSSQLNLSVTKLDSWGPVHSLLIQRDLPPNHPSRNLNLGQAISQEIPLLRNRSPRLKKRGSPTTHIQSALSALFPAQANADVLVSFKIPDCLELPQATFLQQPLRHRLVPLQVYNALFTYTRAVRTLRTSDPAGFVRTQSNKPEYSWVTPNAWDNLQTFALMNAPIRPRVFYEFFLNPFQRLKLHFRQHWQKYLILSSPALSTLVLSPLLLNLKSPIPIPTLCSAFHKQFKAPSHLDLHLPFNKKAVHVPLPGWAQNLVFFLQKNAPFLAPTPPFRPILHWQRPPLLSLLPSPKTTLPLLSLIPTSLYVVHRIFGQLPLQQIHDVYHTNLHPDQFDLSWSLVPYQANCSTPFLPYLLPSETSSQQPAPPRPFSTPLTPPTTIPPPPVVPEPATGANSPSSPKPSTISPPPCSSIPSTTPVIPQMSNSSDVPLLDIDPSTSEPTVTFTGAINHGLSDNPVKPEFPSLESPEPPLMLDPTAAGDVVPFHVLYPASYYANTAMFQTRARVVPSSGLPIPPLNCLLVTVSQQSHYPVESLWDALQSLLPDSLLSNPEIQNIGMSTDLLTALCYHFHLQAVLHTPNGDHPFGIITSSTTLHISYSPGPPRHFSTFVRLTGSLPGSNPTSEPLVRQALRFKHNGHYLPFHQAHSHEVSMTHAKNLISNMKNGFDGILSTITRPSSSGPSPQQSILILDSIRDTSTSRSVPVIHIAGFAGCGKTHPIQQLLKTKPFHDFRISTPTNELRSEWKKDMDPSPANLWRFSTWESSLLKHSAILVIDEIYKLPRGYLDLSIVADPNLKLVIILGDPLQGEYHSISPHSSNSRLPSEISRFRSYIDCYCWWTYRLPKAIANLFHIDTFSEKRGFVSTTHTHPPGSKNLVNSMSTAAALNSLGHHAITISSSQGVTFPEANTILLDRHTNLLSPNNCLVALTRSRTGVLFIGNLHLASASFGTNYMFSQALSGQPIDLMSCFPHLFPHLPIMHSPITSRTVRYVAGQSPLPSVNFSLRGKLNKRTVLPPHIPLDHDLDVLLTNPVVHGSSLDERLPTNHLPPTRLPLHTELISTNPSSATLSEVPSHFNTPFSHAIAGETFENLSAFFLPAHDPELREINFKDSSSSQFPWLDRPFSLSCQPSSLIAAIHSPASDPTLLPSSIKKRLRFRESSTPYSITSHDQILGHHLYNSLCSAYNRSPSTIEPFNPELFAECISINEYAQLSSKTRATIVANHSRSDPDWRYTTVKIFAKAQHKVNDGSIFGSWKACQTLALMHDYIILILGPVKKYQRIIDARDRPPQIYIHCGHTPQQLSSWSQSHLKGSVFLANDYTSFDQSQHGEAVVLELLKMQRLSFPPFFLSLHLHLKTSIETQFGPLTCMRLTGEPGTYDDNSDYNLAVIYSKYSISNHPIMISGDDSVICGSPPLNPQWPNLQKLLHLKFKTEQSDRPLFCGYYVSPLGACRNPLALFAKLMICVDDLTLPDKVLSYLSEFSVGHALGDSVTEVIPSHLIPYYSACHDFFCRNCSPSQKLMLSLDPIPESKLIKLILKVRWASKSFFSMLPQKARDILVSTHSIQSMPFDPKVSQLESELLPNYN
ncbi:putative polyprotein [tomato blistering mosaic tymovirus]|uniref:Non-structural replication polyprotein n=1 Tax=tomato blistering mosaic tymovirus TaxID=2035014 RepID=S5I938_9VIRU|nr:putative polyprotein [Tomato blistering mosaic virus]AGQ80925.1 putative polyprotein [Tomato blistering mosaic virus]